MTDKQIIIDDQKKTIHRLQDECTEKTNAIIALGEQLKRKEQECEELRSKNNYSPEVLKQCPHYKNDNICTYLGYETKCEGDCNYTTFQDFIAEIDDLKNVNSKLQQQLDKLKQNLTEIKELVENDWCLHHESCKLCTDTGSCINKQVLQKISEVDNEHITEN